MTEGAVAAEPTEEAGSTGPARVLCMPGQSYTGSTLLAMLLDCHPAMASIGAASGPTPGTDLERYRCSCGARLGECPFWQDVGRRVRRQGVPLDLARKPWPTAYQAMGTRRLRGLAIRSLRSDRANRARDALLWSRGPVAERLRRTTQANLALMGAVTAVSGTEVFVDSSRDPLRPRYLSAFSDVRVHVVHLVRDPRGNVASILRHRPGLSVDEAARRWWRANVEARRPRIHIPAERWATLHYEQLCEDPQGSLDRIAHLCGLAPSPLPSDFRSQPHHVLGNDMRLTDVGEIRLDERWRDELDRPALAIIEQRCRPLAEELGYEW